MTLPTGTISMSQVNTELGRTSTQAISFNDTDVRRVAGKTSGSISMNDLRGKSNYVDQKIVTVGYGLYSTYPLTIYGYGYHSGMYGSLNNTTFNGFGGVPINLLHHRPTVTILAFSVVGNVENSGWTTMVIDGNSFQRSAANYSVDVYNTFWTWSGVSTLIFGNTVGVQKTVTWY